MARKAACIIVLAVLLAVPTSSAVWRGRGFQEPDTQRDLTGSMMWTGPDHDPTPSVRKVYFSAFSGYYVLTPNHNVALLGTNVMTYPTNIHAVLGIWKDCNRDGFIGIAEGALAEYRVELLNRTDICPEQRVTPGTPGFSPVHNDGKWVREMLVIGPDDVGTDHNDTNPWNIRDDAARIWGDWGLPEDSAKPSCPLNPRPRGTYQSTGGFLRYSDCLLSWRVTTLVNLLAHETGQDGLAFDDAPQERPDQSNSTLNQPNPWGREGDSPYVSAFDCSKTTRDDGVVYHDDTGATHQVVRDSSGTLRPLFGDDNETWVNLTNDSYDRRILWEPRPAPAIDPRGSPAGTINQTEEEAPTGSCNRTDDTGSNGDIYSLDEADFEATTAARKQSDVWYAFTEGAPLNKVCDGGSSDARYQIFTSSLLAKPTCVDNPVDPWMPDDAGQGFLKQLIGTASWFGSPGYAASRNPYVNRDDLQPWGAVHFTAYAHVSPTTGLLPGGKGIYGSAHCNPDGTPRPGGGWTCDGAQWWLGPDGRKLPSNPPPHYQIVPGQLYNLMDVDCYDASNSVTGPGVSTSLLNANSVCRRP